MHSYRTHHCGQLTLAEVGRTVRLSGWIHRKRDHGNLLFLDLRDHYGITQAVMQPEDAGFDAAAHLRAESVVRITGKVVARAPDTVNPTLPTGAVEVRIEIFDILSAADELPLPVFGDVDYPEETRLKYRFLDLRREKLHRNIVLRSEIIASIRRRMTQAGFMEFQTPILTASSPEGARDFLVPSRIHPGKFYALPQAPQQFKQLIMVSGFDRYFQIAPCFRDEDARADRSPGEFYQLDVEMSFVTEEDVFEAIEPILRGLFEEFATDQRHVAAGAFPRIPYAEALLKYGTDKPDLRNPLVISDVTEIFAREDVSFQAFKSQIDKGSVVRAIPGPGTAARPRSFFDRLNDWARKDMAAPGLGYIIFEGGEAKGPIAKFLSAEALSLLKTRAGVNDGDAVFFACDAAAKAAALAGAARTRIGQELEVIDPTAFHFCWIVDFPMYEWNEEEKRVDFSHNPFSMPKGELEALNSKDPLTILAHQYDIVCNGIELSSGAIRNHRPDIMLRAFEIAGYGPDAVEAKFGGMLRAFRYGAPPHGGIAPGVDRIVMLLAGEQNLREVTLFPMNQQAQDLMMGAPAEVTAKQLRELHIRPALPAENRKPG